jgi:hypothetical protein
MINKESKYKETEKLLKTLLNFINPLSEEKLKEINRIISDNTTEDNEDHLLGRKRKAATSQIEPDSDYAQNITFEELNEGYNPVYMLHSFSIKTWGKPPRVDVRKDSSGFITVIGVLDKYTSEWRDKTEERSTSKILS